MNYVKADNDARCISIKRETAGSYVVMLDHVAINGAAILKEGKVWKLYTPIVAVGMDFRTLKEAKVHMLSWFKFSYIPMLNADHAVAEMSDDAKAHAYTGERTIAAIKADGVISRMDYPVPFGRVVTEAHARICAEYECVTYVKNGMDMGMCPRCGNVTTSEEQITREEIAHADRIREVMTNGTAFVPAWMKEEIVSEEKESDAINAVIAVAKEAIAALTPIMERAKVAFETVRDNGSSDEVVGIAYQGYCDLYQSIEEYGRTIAYAESA